MVEESDNERKVFFVIGSTGSRKSQVAIRLAKLLEAYHKFQNVIIVNCDVPQFYEGLPIGTNKGNREDLEGVPHFFLGFLDYDGTKKYSPELPYPHEEPPFKKSGGERYNVTHYKKEVVKFIDEHFQKNEKTAAIVCGGTCYYAQSVMFSNTLIDDLGDELCEKAIRSQDSGNLWNCLYAVDPELASRYHPNDTRRIQRLLDIYYEKGVAPSKLFSSKSISLRYPHSYVIWTFIERPVLEVELSERVEKMVAKGLLLEVYNFAMESKNKENGAAITECIGYKEFEECQDLLEEPLNSSTLSAINAVKSNTLRYARQQLQFIQNRLVPMLSKEITFPLQFVKFDVTHSNSITPGLQVYSENIVLGVDREIETLTFPRDTEKKLSEGVSLQKCTICNALIYGRDQLSLHSQSKRHRGALKRQRLEKDQWEKYGRVLPPKKKKS